MAIVCVDWREAGTADLARLYATEIGRWSTVLGWETDTSWNHIEVGRQLGTVPGLIALDANGATVGWSFYLLHRGVLQIGGFVAASEPVTAALVDAIFASDTAAGARAVTVFVFTDAPGLSSALASRGLTAGGYDYLMKPLLGIDTQEDGVAETGKDVPPIALGGRDVEPVLRRWRARDREAVAALLRTAYPGADGVRPFAPEGTVEEWREYVGQLVAAAGCGTIMPEACYVVANGAEQLSGVVLVTRLAPATAHIAQLAVGPAGQRRGLGRFLVKAACAGARAAGCDRITLLVDGHNVAAGRLYEALGFCAVARFVSAGTSQPLRLTSVAIGGATAMRP